MCSKHFSKLDCFYFFLKKKQSGTWAFETQVPRFFTRNLSFIDSSSVMELDSLKLEFHLFFFFFFLSMPNFMQEGMG